MCRCKRADLARLVATRVQRPEQSEQRGGLQRVVALELADDPWPVGCEWVRPRPVAAWLLELAGQLAKPLIGTGRAHAHPGAGSSLLLSAAFGAFSHHAEDLQVAFHGALLLKKHHVAFTAATRRSGGNSSPRRRQV